MKIYRGSLRDCQDEHQGYVYATSKREIGTLTPEEEITVMDVPLTKEGVMHCLRTWASHPDNG